VVEDWRRLGVDKFMVSAFGRGKGREGDCCSLLMFRLSRLSVCFPQRDRVLSIATRWPH